MLYFDGFSAAKTLQGTLDLQDILAFGRPEGPPPERGLDDHQRASRLCEWGKQFGIEGFVREEATFEVFLAFYFSKPKW